MSSPPQATVNRRMDIRALVPEASDRARAALDKRSRTGAKPCEPRLATKAAPWAQNTVQAWLARGGIIPAATNVLGMCPSGFRLHISAGQKHRWASRPVGRV